MSRAVVAEILRGALAASGLKQNELARRVGRDAATINRWLKGTQLPDGTIVPLLARSLDLDEADLWAAVNSAINEKLSAAIKENRQLTRWVEDADSNINDLHEKMDRLVQRLDGLIAVLEPLVKSQPGLEGDGPGPRRRN